MVGVVVAGAGGTVLGIGSTGAVALGAGEGAPVAGGSAVGDMAAVTVALGVGEDVAGGAATLVGLAGCGVTVASVWVGVAARIGVLVPLGVVATAGVRVGEGDGGLVELDVAAGALVGMAVVVAVRSGIAG